MLALRNNRAFLGLARSNLGYKGAVKSFWGSTEVAQSKSISRIFTSTTLRSKSGMKNETPCIIQQALKSRNSQQIQQRAKSSITGGNGGSSEAWSSRFFNPQAINEFLLAPRLIRVPRWISPQHFSITLSEVFGHMSFLLVFCSYAEDDFLMLRTIAVAGSACILVFSYFHPHGRPLWLPFKCNVLFIAVNCYRIGTALYDKYRATCLSEEYLSLHHDHFHVIELVDFAKLINLGEKEVFKPGDVVVDQGEWNEYLRLVLEGELDVFRDGHRTYSLEEGNFISEVGLHAGLKLTGPVESSAKVATRTDTRGHVKCIRWNRTKLMDLLEKEKNLNRSFQSVLGWDVVSKLKAQRTLLTRKTYRGTETPEEVIGYRQDQSVTRYRYILHNVLSRKGGDIRAFKEDLDNYRYIHHISKEEHRKALQECGWTEEEYEKALKRRKSKGIRDHLRLTDASLES